jgi:DNA-binding transcriptional LysR family regulator
MGTVDLNDLQVFVAVVETGSFSKAADRLGLPKSSVSRAIARFEEALGARMLHRTTRKVAPSTAGRVLYEKVRGEIAALRNAVAERPEIEDEPSGRLRVTASLSFEYFLADVVAQFVGRYRAVEVDLHLTNTYVDLVAEGIDIGLRFATKPLKSSTVTMRKLSPGALELYAAPSYLALKGAPRAPADLARHDWVVFDRAPPALRLAGGGAPVLVPTRGRIRCDDMAFAREAVLHGCGIGYFEAGFVRDQVALGKVVRVLPQWNVPVSHLYAVWPGGRKLPRKASAFLDLMIETLKARPIA